MRELAVYRMNLGLPSTPQPHEPYPLVMALNDGGIHPEAPPQHASLRATESPQNGVNPAQLRPLTRATIHRLVKTLCQRTADRLRQIGPEHESDAQLLTRVSPHWLRHTAGTHMVENDIDIFTYGTPWAIARCKRPTAISIPQKEKGTDTPRKNTVLAGQWIRRRFDKPRRLSV